MTITDDLGIDDLCAVLDAEGQADGSMVGSATLTITHAGTTGRHAGAS